MKSGIHPTWYSDCQVSCACGNQFVIGSINPTLQVDICNKCHPFFTNEVRFADRQGRVDRFNKAVAAAQAAQATAKPKAQSKTADTADSRSYKDILRAEQASLRKSVKTDKKSA